MKILTRWLFVCFSVLVFNYQASAAYFDGIYIFGDSLSDSGAYIGSIDAGGGGKFTTNPGPVWTETLGAYYGLEVISNNPNNPNTSPTGNNYAQGGAQVTNPIGIGQTPSPQGALSIEAQISNYLTDSQNMANPNGLYTLWGGANDIFYNSSRVGSGLDDVPTAINNIIGSAADLVAQAERLFDAGAGTILIPNLPDVGATPASIFSAISAVGAGNPNLDLAIQYAVVVLRTPANSPSEQMAIQNQAILAAEMQLGLPTGVLAGAVNGTRDLFSAMSVYYNDYLETFLTAEPENIILLDIESLFSDVLANPYAFGFSNVTGTACNTISSLSCTAAYLASPNAAYELLFADGVHPTTAGHAIIANYAIAALEVSEPSVLFLLLPVLGLLVSRRRKDY